MASAVDTRPWHRGELAAQRLAHVDPAHTRKVAPYLRSTLNEQHRAFYPLLPFVVAGSVDDAGVPWATIVEGAPGFLQAIDDTHLRIGALPRADDPALPGLAAGRAVGLLGIELATRRRNRLNGRIERADEHGLQVAVVQAYGNCPRYIATHVLAWTTPETSVAETADTLDDEARALIGRSGSLFVASYADEGGRGVDVSHRGGRPGFVAVDGEWLTIPDFNGNQFYNTLGNFLVNPRAGLLFADFESGDLLQLAGTVEVLFDSPLLAGFAGAERGWRVHVERLVRRRGALGWRGAALESSPAVAGTDTWADLRAREATQAAQHWREFEVERVVDETDAIRSFHLRPVVPAPLPPGDAGQHLVLRLPGPSGAEPLVRSYSLSRLTRDGAYRISVKRDGAGSRALYATLVAGARLDLRGPQGEFVVDGASRRPLVLLSAGIGITPLLAMAEQAVEADRAAAAPRRIHFLHGARDGRAMPFRAELAALAARSRGALELVRVFSRPGADDVHGVDYERAGHLDIDALKATLPFDDLDFYLCGPTLFMQELHDDLRERGTPEDRIHAEAFGPSSLRRSGVGAVPAAAPSATAVPVRFVASGRQATWTPGGASLLALAEAQGLAPEFGCRSGTCGSCRVAVDGDVAYPGRAAPAGPAGTALVCCAVPAQGCAALEIAL